MNNRWLESVKENDHVIIRQGNSYHAGKVTSIDTMTIHVGTMQFHRTGIQKRIVRIALPTPRSLAELLEPTAENYEKVKQYQAQKQ